MSYCHRVPVKIKAQKLDGLGRLIGGVVGVETEPATCKVGKKCGVDPHEKCWVGVC